ncbi:hypothetical protein MSAN_00766500 [Mycena sanguinolenta]|uniref:Uncharacterized protein n=1 Tax=Mycena sanguinolenta TaxID=230812 RepID=A0A8H7DDC6_9AGAR|nr:hypothetical protein MSAN_00766500 [Mycena sanguinolenta]
MYHRQAAGFIERNRGAALSSESLQVLSSYLGCKYVGHSTNLMVLQELDEKLRSSEESRRVMVDDPVGLQLVVEMLDSPFLKVRRLTCTILGHLAVNESTMSISLRTFGNKLVPLIRDHDDTIVETVMLAFSAAVRCPGGAQAFIDAELLNSVPKLMESPRPFVRTQACWLVGHLAVDESTVSTALSMFGIKLVPLMRDEDDNVVEKAVWAASAAVRCPRGGQAFIDTELSDRVPELLESSRPFVRTHACWLVGRLASHAQTRTAFPNGQTVTAVLESKFCVQLVGLLRDEDIYVIQAAELWTMFHNCLVLKEWFGIGAMSYSKVSCAKGVLSQES